PIPALHRGSPCACVTPKRASGGSGSSSTQSWPCVRCAASTDDMATSLPGGWFESGHGSIAVLIKDFRDPLQRKKKLILKPWASIKDIKDQLQVVFNVPTTAQKLYFQGRELKNAHNLQQCGIYQDNAVVDFVARRQQNLAIMYAGTADTRQQEGRRNSGSGKGTTRTTGAGANGRTTLAALAANAAAQSSAAAEGSSNLLPHQMPVMSIHPFGAHLLPVSLMKVMHQALQGLALGLAPTLAMDGTGGTYFLRDPSHRNVGCFKPQDEEPFGPNNPRGLVGELGQSGLRRGILSGEACERELAAYLLDKDHFAGVPATALVEARHPAFKYGESNTFLHFKTGSLQEFVRHDDVVSDLAPNQFSNHQVHKIVLLDMRLLNTDRNDANILVRKKRSPTGQVEYDLIPIDHGYCLPQYLEIAWCDWCWYNWPQLKQPLSKEDRAYVLSLNMVEDVDALSRKIPLRRACRRNIIISGMVLQRGVKAGLNLFEIARIMCREDLDAPSILETMCIDAFNQVVRHRQSPKEKTPPKPEPIATSAKEPTKAPFGRPNLRVSIDIPSPDEAFGNGHSPKDSGARSPPGFWASYNPFKSSESDDDRDSYKDSNGPNGISFSWDAIASNALSDAVKSVELNDSSSSRSDSPVRHGEVETTSNCGTSFGTDTEKDDFELLNEGLDENAQEERLFLSLLGRLIDEQVAASLVRQQTAAANANSSSKRSSSRWD
ncbi:TPA: hypothetical protein N0F65_002427, partial [Lagenidium giganteum]